MLSRLAAVLLVSGLAGSASAQPKVIEIKGPTFIHPTQVEEIRKRLLEDVEMAQAQRDTKKEQLKAAEVLLDVSKKKLAAVEKEGNATQKADASAAVDLATAALDVRKAEMKEAELKVVHNKRRYDSGIWPLTLTPVPTPEKFPPMPVVPPVKKPDGNEGSALPAKVEAAKAQVAQAKANLAKAEADLERTKELIMKGIVAKADYDANVASVDAASAEVKVAEAKLAEAQAAMKAAPPQVIVTTTTLGPQSKLPARVGYPTPMDTFNLLQLEVEVANLRFEFAQVEVGQLQKLGITGEQMDAAKARFEDAKKSLNAAEDKVLNASNKFDPFAK